MSTTVRAHVALGSNLGDRQAHLEAAVGALAGHPSIQLLARSSIYETNAVGPGQQGPYLNAVVAIETTLGARALLDLLLDIERQRGRQREAGVRWGPRTLDLDLLTFGGEQIDEPGLEVPHPRMAERSFVLEPLCDVAGDELHPVSRQSYRELARAVRVPDDVRRWRASAAQRGGETWPSSP